jgi:hypothetical protein
MLIARRSDLHPRRVISVANEGDLEFCHRRFHFAPRSEPRAIRRQTQRITSAWSGPRLASRSSAQRLDSSLSFEWNNFVKDNFTVLLTIGIVTTAIALALSIVYRAAKRKNIVSIPKQDVLFKESWVSGASQKNLLTKLGGAGNCLSITLSRNALIIRPMFPFNLMFFGRGL